MRPPPAPLSRFHLGGCGAAVWTDTCTIDGEERKSNVCIHNWVFRMVMRGDGERDRIELKIETVRETDLRLRQRDRP